MSSFIHGVEKKVGCRGEREQFGTGCGTCTSAWEPSQPSDSAGMADGDRAGRGLRQRRTRGHPAAAAIRCRPPPRRRRLLPSLCTQVESLFAGSSGRIEPALPQQAAHAGESSAADLQGSRKAERLPTYSASLADPSRPVDEFIDSTFASRYVSEPIAKNQ